VGDRDRDSAGRARNARPRDDLGRPLARLPREDDPSQTAPADAGLAPPISPREAAALGGRLLAEGRPFHAHEVFEEAWKSVPGPERELWRGLAQIAVGLTHAGRGNASGAVALLRRGAANVRESAWAGDGSGPADGAGVDPEYVAGQAEALAARIERAGLAAVPETERRLTLRP
jgi:uncharacterized protein